MRLPRLIPFCLGLGGVGACAGPPATTPIGPAWIVSAEPVVSVDDKAVPRGHEFNGISSARRLRDHSILVANSGAFELAHFDSAGRFRRSIGRKGQGPGEFQGPLSVFAWRGDSLAVYDPAVLRWTILNPALVLGRTAQAPDSDILQPTWLYQGAVVNDGLMDPVPVWVTTVLDSVRRRDPQFRRLIRARRDDLGALWIRDSLDERTWAVYRDGESAAASAVLPLGLEPLHIGEDFVLGVVYDSLGVEALRIHSLARSPSGPEPRNSAAARLPTDAAILAAFPNLLLAQELYYSSHAKYAAHADSLALGSPFPARFFLLAGDARHWTAVAVRPETGATCGLSVGWPAPIGWLDGTPFCGR